MKVEPRLTEKEKEVLSLITVGLESKEIAFKLNITYRTVNCHRRSINLKLCTNNLAILTHYALSKGLIQLIPIST